MSLRNLIVSLTVVALPILVAVGLHQWLFAGIHQPPADFGTGTMFDQIAGRYDVINRILAVGMDISWRRRMVREIQAALLVQEEEEQQQTQQPRDEKEYHILDVATGTADVALELAAAIPNAVITGVDPSENMLNKGRSKIHNQGLDHAIRLQRADARKLDQVLSSRQRDQEPPIRRRMFDAATMAFGIRNVPREDRDEALCQIHSLLKDRSRFCILEFSEPDPSVAGFMGSLARLFIRYILPVMGALLSGAPREYWHLQNSIQDFPSPQEFGAYLEQIDCSKTASAVADHVNVNSKAGPPSSFQLDDLIQLNFQSVQIYVTRVIHANEQNVVLVSDAHDRTEPEPLARETRQRLQETDTKAKDKTIGDDIAQREELVEGRQNS